MSEFNAALYRLFVGPWVRTLANPWSAEMLKWLHPMRASRYLYSEAFNPWMGVVAVLARTIAGARQPLAQDHPWIERERKTMGEVSHALERTRTIRDAACEQAFLALYGHPSGGSVRNG